jgi:hypothetical protein
MGIGIDPPGSTGGTKGKVGGMTSGVSSVTGVGSGSERGKEGVSAMRLPQRVRERFVPSVIAVSPL